MTLQRDRPKDPTARLRKIVWICTVSIAGACLIAGIIIAIVNHVKIF